MLTATVVFLPFLALASPGDPLPSLLPRLADSVALSTRSQKTGGVEIAVHAEELDKHGKPAEVQEYTLRSSHDAAGREHSEILRAVKDGQDITEAERKKAAAKKDDPDDDASISLAEGDPFAAGEAPQYRFQVTSREGDRLTVQFEPKAKPTKDLRVGQAVVDTAKAMILEETWRPAVLPSFVSRLTMHLVFSVDDPVHGALPSRLEMEGEGGFLFVHKRYRMTSTFTTWSFSPQR